MLLAGTAAWLGAVSCGTPARSAEKADVLKVYTFGDSILDCGHYNEHGVTPGQLVVRNEDRLFPEFKGRDLATRRPAQLVHRARDGGTVRSLPSQAEGLTVNEPAVALLTVGGNDLLGGLVVDRGPGFDAFAKALDDFLKRLPIRPVLVGNVYDPSFGDDRNNFLGIDPAVARASHQRMDEILADAGREYGALVDLHAHFLKGDPSWLTRTIEPSLTGASEVRRMFLEKIPPCKSGALSV
ncbi:MAG: SGNH/GDSL hydrolase family protein [Chloroflexi bacterium]|nr:SGNH/GDSL hydrolase family protein [Chloroflexota bacterium]